MRHVDTSEVVCHGTACQTISVALTADEASALGPRAFSTSHEIVELDPSLADKLRVGDVVVAFNGRPLAAHDRLEAMVKGQRCELRVECRGGGEAAGRGGALSVQGTLSGETNLYVGERYALVVPKSAHFDESSAEFTVSGVQGTSVLLRLERAVADLTVVLKSAHAGTAHHLAALPFPGGVTFHILHEKGTKVLTMQTRDDSRAEVRTDHGRIPHPAPPIHTSRAPPFTETNY